jgi:uncharacterized protein (DUF433 family)
VWPAQLNQDRQRARLEAEPLMAGDYIEQRDGQHYVSGTGISLDSVVHSFRSGNSPDTIQSEFPALKLSQIYGAIAFYLNHRAVIDRSLTDKAREFEASAIPLSEADPKLWMNLEGSRHAISNKKL